MAVDFDRLLKLQDCDLRLRQIAKHQRDIPLRKAAIEERLSGHQKALHDAQEKQKKHMLKVKELEGEIEGQKQKIAKHRQQQMTVKSNDDYRTLEREIATTQKAIRLLEDNELVVMEEMEQLATAVHTRKGELTTEEEEVRQELVRLDEMLVEIEEQLVALREERKAMVEGMDSAVLARYERILGHVGDAAIVGVQGGACEGCNMRLPPQLVHDARKKETLTICNYCGRILYSAH